MKKYTGYFRHHVHDCVIYDRIMIRAIDLEDAALRCAEFERMNSGMVCYKIVPEHNLVWSIGEGEK